MMQHTPASFRLGSGPVTCLSAVIRPRVPPPPLLLLLLLLLL